MQRYRSTNKTKQIVYFLIIPFLALSTLAACRDYDFDDTKIVRSDNSIGAYMSLTFSTHSKNNHITRSASASESGQASTDYDENPTPLHWAEWEGNDVIDKVYVYIFNGAGEDASYETTKVLAGSEFEIEGDTYTLKEPFLSTLGQKRVFVLVNLNQRLIAKINTKATAGCTAKDFRDFLQSSGWSDPSISTVPTSQVSQTRADEFVTKVGGKDAIVMTGEPVDVEITEQMKETVKNSTTINTATVNVERVVAKVIVTIDENFKLHETDLAKVREQAQGADDAVLPYASACMLFKDSESDVSPKAYISDITWTVVQGASDLYFLKKPSEDKETFEYNAQNQETLPMEETTVKGKELKNGEDEWKNEEFWTDVVPQYADFSDFFDYSGLWKKEGNSTIPYGIDIQATTPYVTETEGEAKTETNNLKAEVAGLHSEYLLPTYAGSTALNQRGNTAYILIRARVHPLRYATIKHTEDEEGGYDETVMVAAEDDGFKDLSTFYFDPISNRFGDSPEVLMNESLAGNPETIMKYTDGYMYYFLLPNATKPNDKNTAKVSPILRNQFYHIQIKKALDMGYPWNPLVPYPKGTQGSENPIIENPQNPNPRPEDDNLRDKYGPITQKQTGIHPHTNINRWLHRNEAYDNDQVKDEYLEKFTRSSHQSRTNQSRAFGQGLSVTFSSKRK